MKDSALSRLFMFWISEQFLRENTPFRLFIELNRHKFCLRFSLFVSLFLFAKKGNAVFRHFVTVI